MTFYTYRTLEDNISFRIFRIGWHNTGTIDEVDTLHKSDILPDLGFTRDGSNIAHLFSLKSVDDGRLASVGISDKTDLDLFLIAVQAGELTQELNERTFAERVVDGCVEGECGIVFGKIGNPFGL